MISFVVIGDKSLSCSHSHIMLLILSYLLMFLLFVTSNSATLRKTSTAASTNTAAVTTATNTTAPVIDERKISGICDVQFSKKVVLIKSLDKMDEGKQLTFAVKKGMVKLDKVYEINKFQAPFLLHADSSTCIELKPGAEAAKIICFKNESTRKDVTLMLTKSKLCMNQDAKPRADLIGTPSAEEEEDNAFHNVKPSEGGVLLTFYPSEGVNPEISVDGN